MSSPTARIPTVAAPPVAAIRTARRARGRDFGLASVGFGVVYCREIGARERVGFPRHRAQVQPRFELMRRATTEGKLDPSIVIGRAHGRVPEERIRESAN